MKNARCNRLCCAPIVHCFSAHAQMMLVRVLKALALYSLLIIVAEQADASWQEQSSRQLEQLLADNPDQLPELNEPALQDFYRMREYRLLWSTPQGWLNRAYDLLNAIYNADEHGLETSDYYLDEIRQFSTPTDLEVSVRIDLLLSAALLRYATHVHSGRFEPGELDADWYIETTSLDVRSLFAQVADKQAISELLDTLPPPHNGYRRLKRQLRRYRAVARTGDWQRFEPGPLLEHGVCHKQVLQLRRRLQMTGDLLVDPFAESEVFDRWLEQGVRSYQQRHGLKVDGKVGPQTRRSLNVPLAHRVRQIRINLERWRWLPRTLGTRYLVVNMAGFELYIVNNDDVVLAMPVIVGKAYRSTPTFSGRLSYMEYNPHWTIPRKLVLEDILPRQLSDPGYLSRKSIRVYRGWGGNVREIDPSSVDWKQVNENHFPYWLRQDPGPNNALGRVKFLFANPYAIYLHGTPDKHLFDRVSRAFSSGCIRVRDPVRLAAYLLGDGSQQIEEDVLANIHLGTRQGVTLPKTVPIYLIYWTAWVDQHGHLNFRDDIYGRDATLNASFDPD